MAEHEHAVIKHSDHILLDQPLVRLPNELLRNNFRAAHFVIERENTYLKSTLRDAVSSLVSGQSAPRETARILDAEISRLRTARGRLASLADEEATLHRQLARRAGHLDELIRLKSVDDALYDNWSRTRLDRLIIDYLLRHGWTDTARALAAEREIEDLVDVDTFVTMSNIRDSLKGGSVTEALQWSLDNKRELRKMDSNLEFMLRLQQFIELVRQQKRLEAIAHARKSLAPFKDTYPTEILQVCGLLASMPPPSASKTSHSHEVRIAYQDFWSPDRWEILADIFTQAYSSLLSLPSIPLLDIALSSGLSALKTPACHSTSHRQPHPSTNQAVGSNGITGAYTINGVSPENPIASQPIIKATPPGQTVCPICSTELHELARHMPYAHHMQSHIAPDQMLLPNLSAYGMERLTEQARKAGLAADHIKDPRTGEVYPVSVLKKVFIS